MITRGSGTQQQRVDLASHAPELPEHLILEFLDTSLRGGVRAALRVHLADRDVPSAAHHRMIVSN